MNYTKRVVGRPSDMKDSCTHFTIGVHPSWAGGSSTVAIIRGEHVRTDNSTQVRRATVVGIHRLPAGASWNAVARKVDDAIRAIGNSDYQEAYGIHLGVNYSNVPRIELERALKGARAKHKPCRITHGIEPSEVNGVPYIPRIALIGRLDTGFREDHLLFTEEGSENEAEARKQLEAMKEKAPKVDPNAFADDPEDLAQAIAIAYWWATEKPRFPGVKLRSDSPSTNSHGHLIPRSRWANNAATSSRSGLRG